MRSENEIRERYENTKDDFRGYKTGTYQEGACQGYAVALAWALDGQSEAVAKPLLAEVRASIIRRIYDKSINQYGVILKEFDDSIIVDSIDEVLSEHFR